MTVGFLFDALGVLGTVMLGYGLYLISPVHMYIGIGALLLTFALLAARNGGKLKKKG